MGCSVSSTVQAGPQRFSDKYRVGQPLGAGSFGRVLEAFPLATDSQPKAAVKIISQTEPPSLDAVREMKAWQHLGAHQHCVELFEVFMEPGCCYFVMERCYGSLKDRLKHIVYMPEADIMTLIRQMLLGLNHVHLSGIVHRDVKAENFLFGGDDMITLKVCDFGLATELQPGTMLSGICGSLLYMSPEMLNNKPYDFCTDVWSMGVAAHLMLFGEYLTPAGVSKDAIRAAIRDNDPETVPRRFRTVGPHAGAISSSAGLLLKGLLHRDTQERLTCSEALSLPVMLPSNNNISVEGFEGSVSLASSQFSAGLSTEAPPSSGKAGSGKEGTNGAAWAMAGSMVTARARERRTHKRVSGPGKAKLSL